MCESSSSEVAGLKFFFLLDNLRKRAISFFTRRIPRAFGRVKGSPEVLQSLLTPFSPCICCSLLTRLIFSGLEAVTGEKCESYYVGLFKFALTSGFFIIRMGGSEVAAERRLLAIPIADIAESQRDLFENMLLSLHVDRE